MSDLINAVVAYKAIDHCVTSADARLNYRANSEQLDYLRQRDRMIEQEHEASQAMERYAMDIACSQHERDKEHDSREADRAREHEYSMHKEQLALQEYELNLKSQMQAQAIYSNMKMKEMELAASTAISDRNREAAIAMQAKQLDQNERLELRRLSVQQNIAKQEQELQRYLFEMGIKSNQELERFKALAMRETQILLARENAQNTLQDHLVQEALANFPLNISPIVLLRNRPHSLKGLMRFSSTLLDQKVLPDIAQVYNDVTAYSKNPEALNIFIAPIHIDSKIENKAQLSQQIWDTVYHQIESYITRVFNRCGSHPVILYPTAWKDHAAAGQHASETLHFFLRDMPCLVLEPRFDGHSLSIIFSSWGLGYVSTEHLRTEMAFDVNLYTSLIQSAYERSVKSLRVLDDINNDMDGDLEKIKADCQRNVDLYDKLSIKSRIEQNRMDEINALGVYNLFKIDPVSDLSSISQTISALIGVNISIMADVHHLMATDSAPVFPAIFKNEFLEIFNNREYREIVSKCYERAYLFLRNENVFISNPDARRDMERVREMQITNVQKQLELIDTIQVSDSIDEKVRKYAMEQHGIEDDNIDVVWDKLIDIMTVNDVSFFKEILQNIDDRRRYKRIDKRIADISRNS